MDIIFRILKRQFLVYLFVFAALIPFVILPRMTDRFSNNMGIVWTFKNSISGSPIDNTWTESACEQGAADSAYQSHTRELTMGNLFWRLEDTKKAVECWHHANVDADFFLDKMVGVDTITGLDYINRSIAMEPNRSEFLFYKGLHYEKIGDDISTNYWYERANDLNTWSNTRIAFDSHYERGQLLFQQGDLPEAENVLAKALQFSVPTTPDYIRKLAMTHRWLGIINQRKGKLEQATSHFESAIALNPKDLWNYFNLASIAESQELSEDTVFQYYFTGQEVAPHDIWSYVYPARIYYGQGDFARWEFFCEQAPHNLRREQSWAEACEQPSR